MRVLILGGSGEARALASLIGGDMRFDVMVSLAGRTAAPAALPVPTRRGGFGGAEGLARFLREGQFDALVDATHPFAATISANAVAAAQRAAVPLATLARDPWTEAPGDRWIKVADMRAAADALGAVARRVFLTVGRLELGAFAAAPQHTYLARTIDLPQDTMLPAQLAIVQARPPFDADAEADFLATHRIDVLVSKNSGSADTYGKIVAARRLGLPVVMVERPAKPAGIVVSSPGETVAWLERLETPHDAASLPASRRGV